MKHRIQGSVVPNPARKTWVYLYTEGKKRTSKRLGKLDELTEKEAWKLAEAFLKEKTHTIDYVIAQYEKLTVMRGSSWHTYHSVFRQLERQFGGQPMTAIDDLVVQDWLNSRRSLRPGSKGNIRGILSQLWKFAMKRRMVPMQLNPMSLVEIKDVSVVTRKHAVLNEKQFVLWFNLLRPPYSTIAMVSLAHGLRVSEVLGLKWMDIDWETGKMRIERAIVRQQLDRTKTDSSESEIQLIQRTLEELKLWRIQTLYKEPEDFVFASTFSRARFGRRGSRPYSTRAVWDNYHRAARKLGIKNLGTHALRHTFASWVDFEKPTRRQKQESMRHRSPVTTDRYGQNLMPESARELQAKVAARMFQALDSAKVIPNDFRPV